MKKIISKVFIALVTSLSFSGCMSIYDATIKTRSLEEPVIQDLVQEVQEETVAATQEDPIEEVIPEEIVETEEVVVVLDEVVTEMKSVEEIASEVIHGSWGNGADRFEALRAAGYDPDEVQSEVNRILGGTVASKEPTPVVVEKYVEDPVVNQEWIEETTWNDQGGVEYEQEVYYEPAQEQYYVEETYEEPVYYDSGDWYDASWYDGKTIQIGNYSSVIHSYGGQWAVDEANSSSAEAYERTCIMDHAYQGFTVIKWSDVAYIGGERFYKVATYPYAKNMQYYFDMGDGRGLGECTEPGIVMYTCNDWGGESITITFWVKG